MEIIVRYRGSSLFKIQGLATKDHIKIWNIRLRGASCSCRQVENPVGKWHKHTVCWMGQIRNSVRRCRCSIVKCIIPCNNRLHRPANFRIQFHQVNAVRWPTEKIPWSISSHNYLEIHQRFKSYLNQYNKRRKQN